MSVLDHLIAAPGVYWGEGHGPGGGPFVARVAIVAEAEHSIVFDYEAWSPPGGLHHAESARMARTDSGVVLAATSNGGDDTMVFREGDPGVFGSIGPQKVGLVLDVADQQLTFSWWWTGRDGVLREQSRASLSPMRQIVPAPSVPGEEDEPATSPPQDDAPDAADPDADEHGPDRERVEPQAAEPDPETDPETDTDTDTDTDTEPVGAEADGAEADSPDVAGSVSDAEQSGTTVPWPGILVLNGPSTGIVAQRLAARLTRAAVVRTDLFDRAVRGTAGRPDPALRQRIALSVVQGYAATGHPVILHGASSRSEHEALAEAISRIGLSPVKLVDVAEGEDYGEVARRLIESD